MLLLCAVLCFFYSYCDHRDLHVLTPSFPPRRSSDLRTRAAGATATIRAAGLRQPAARLAPRSQSRCARAARPGVTPMKFILAVSAIALATAPTSAQNVASPKAPAPVAAPAIAPAPKPPVRRVRVKRPISPNVARVAAARSEEHTSELQSLMRHSYACF